MFYFILKFVGGRGEHKEGAGWKTDVFEQSLSVKKLTPNDKVITAS
jgi:hypothetical protein